MEDRDQRREDNVEALTPSVSFAYGFCRAPGIAFHASLAQCEVGVRYFVGCFLFEHSLFTQRLSLTLAIRTKFRMA